MSVAGQVERSITMPPMFSLQKGFASTCWSMDLTRRLFLLALILTLSFSSPVSFVSSAAPIRQLDISTTSSTGLFYLQTEKGFAAGFPLKTRDDVNSSHSLIEKNRRNLVGDARMTLHDDLLSKGYYTSSLLIGTPAHEFALIVDTGSTVTYVPCSTCTHCGEGHQDAAFKAADSSTYEPIPCTSTKCDTGLCGEKKQCKYERQYAESSTSSGVLGMDLFNFGDTGLGSPKLLFGCENDETGDLFFQKADGIMGLGRGPFSIVDQLVQEKGMADTFSLCYGGMDVQGGNMIMGDYTVPPGMVFTPSDPKRSPYYNIVLKQIKVAGTALALDPGVFNAKYGTVLDSGTTYAYLPEKAFNEFQRAVFSQLKGLTAVAGPDPQYQDVCFQGVGIDPTNLSEYFPTVELVFGESSLALEPENYLFKHTQIPGAYCLGVFKNENDHTTLLGGIVVRNMLVKYDRANKQIGFWRTNCTNLWTNLQDAYDSKNPPPSPPPPEPVSAPPPPPPEPVAEPPPAAPVQPEVTEPAAEASKVGPITDQHIGRLELNISVVANFTTFRSLSSAFVEDMARDLQLDIRQVRLLDFQDQGSDVAVTCAVSSASTTSPLTGSTAETIIGRLKQHEVRFRNDFGSYHLNNWRLVPEERFSWAASHVGLAVGLAVLGIALGSAGVTLWSYRRSRDNRTRNMKYDSVDPLGYNPSREL